MDGSLKKRIADICETTAEASSDSASDGEELEFAKCPNQVTSDLEGGTLPTEATDKADETRFIYSYRELKALKTVFFVKRDYILHHYRAHP
jgi:hypothetical protein